MIVEITGLERGGRESRNGNVLTGLLVTGIKKGYRDAPDTDWEKFLYDFNAAEHIAKLEEFGVGSTVKIQMERDGNFWNIVDIAIWGSGGGSYSPPRVEHNSDNSGSPTPVSSGKQSVSSGGGNYREPAEIIRGEALREATKMYGIMFANSGEYTKLLGAKTRLTAELLIDDVIGTAKKFEAFIEGKESDAVVESNTDDLNPDVPEVGGVDIPGEDAPF